MVNIDEVKEHLDNKKRNLFSDVRLRPSDETIMLYLYNDKVTAIASSKTTSIRQLEKLKKELSRKFLKKTEVILVQNESQQELESGLFQILNRKFDDKIVSFFISFRLDSIVDAYIEVSGLTSELEQEIHEHFKKILDDAQLVLGAINWLSSPSALPTIPALLRALKVQQPVSLQEFTTSIQASYRSVTDKWLAHKLDQLRKKSLVIRQKDSGKYVITGQALGLIPAGTRRTSSDIERALALGKRKW